MLFKFQLSKIYVSTICLAGIILFGVNFQIHLVSLSDWVLTYTLIGAVLLLNHFSIILPPTGNSFSMDSSIYLACIFVFGLEIPLIVLFSTSIIFFLIHYKSAVSKHLFNFANYSLMIIITSYVFVLTGGIAGQVDLTVLGPYTISLTVYFLLNVFIIGIYFSFSDQTPLVGLLKGIVKKGILVEVFINYLSTLVLALVLTILIHHELYFGLFLFIVLSVLLSFAFKKFFDLYKSEEEKAKKDFLTGLHNHGHFKLMLDELTLNQDQEHTFCVSLMDLDDFKKYNDANGHIQGDELLKFFGKFLTGRLENHHIAARYGGEEFGIIMPNTSKREAFTFINKLRKEFSDTIFKGVEALPLGCISFSAGIVEFEKGTYSSSELLSKADKALYYAKAQGKNNVQAYKEGQNVYQEGLQIIHEVEALEQQLQIFLSKDVYTYQHSKRVFTYATEFSEVIHLSPEEKRNLILGALIHDIGKLEIPRDVINKKGKLDYHEWEMMKKHVTYGKEIIASIKKYDELLPIIELHHERFDGKGYPYGLKDESIPKLARILCMIDSFDAMTTERPYQKTKTFTEGIKELRKCAGEQFDPRFVEPFIHLIQENYIDKLASENEALPV
jgi:diguanylate cyclase (GGDEF)-like protein/putative nucleotidyltransferase with HDIG domain